MRRGALVAVLVVTAGAALAIALLRSTPHRSSMRVGTVPDLVGLRLSDAAKQARAARLPVTVTFSTARRSTTYDPDAIVVSQSPPARWRAAGAALSLVVRR
jgi:beta-lactam-binding protein with PASTA domain